MEGSSDKTVMTADEVLVGGDEAISYRSVSVLALVGLLVGLLSPLSFVAPLLWAIPIVGTALTITAIVRIASSDGALIGRRAALVGLVLCVVSLSAAASQAVFTPRFHSRHARDAALEWISLLQDDKPEYAYNLTRASIEPPAAPAPGSNDSGHDREPAESPLEQFRENPVVSFLMTDAAGMRVAFDRDLGIVLGPRDEVHIEQQFTLRAAGAGASTPAVILQIGLWRSRPTGLTPARWMVADYRSDDLPAPPADAVP